MRDTAIIYNNNDNVAVAANRISAGQTVKAGAKVLKAQYDIPAGHKIALSGIIKGGDVIKYGYPIGRAIKDIAAGDWVHSHNLNTSLEETVEYEYLQENSTTSYIPERSFEGYLRSNGEAGIRNEIWIINTVSCVNKTAEIIASKAKMKYTGMTDGIFSFSHPFGCSQLGGDLLNTQKILSGLVHHPNAAGVLVLGLGCENNNIDAFKQVLGSYDKERIRFLKSQDVVDEIEEGVSLVGELVDYACRFQKRKIGFSKLKIGLKCGGSDAFSGITANPLIGKCSDMIVSSGGTVILTEVPEMFGAETILLNRCIDRSVYEQTVQMIESFKNYYTGHGQVIYDNPSPGNKEGGITTLEEKSLGCIQKCGTANIGDVVNYGQRVKKTGLSLLYGPGNDLVACTALVAAGAQLILFTTGQGTPLGALVPTIKISSNSELFNRKNNWMDFDAGRILQGEKMVSLSTKLFNSIIQTASCTIKTKNELNGFKEIGIFKDGVYL